MTDTQQAFTIQATVLDFPTGLLTAAEVGERLHVDPARVQQFAEDGYAPHWRVDNGPPLFKLKDIREWCARNLVSECGGTDLPRKPARIILEPELAHGAGIPKVLREVEDLRDISGLINQLRTGIYFLCYASQVVYVGQSISIATRLQDHLKVKEFDRVFLLPWPRRDLDRLETALIRHLRPPLNGCVPRGKAWDGEMETLAMQILGQEVIAGGADAANTGDGGQQAA